MAGITKLLQRAIEKARELPAEDQDAVAVAVLSMSEETPIVAIDEETRGNSRRARRGELRKSRRSGNVTVYQNSLYATCADDLQSILRYIDERSTRGAIQVKRAVQKPKEMIGEFPESGRRAGARNTRGIIPI